jgi:Mg2+ and Co2+ transporter CorA
MVAETVVHSAGINWEQALATWVPISIAVIGSVAAAVRSIRKWQGSRQKLFQGMIDGSLEVFAQTIAKEMRSVHQHLGQQDQTMANQDKRLDRIDRNTGTDST